MKNKITILIFLLFTGNTHSMHHPSHLEELFPELKTYIIQFLREDSILETLKNIFNLYLTNKQFKTIIDNNPALIKDLIHAHFRTGSLNREFSKAIQEREFKNAGLFLRFDIAPPAKAIFLAVVYDRPEFINYLYNNRIITNVASLPNYEGELLTPLGVALEASGRTKNPYPVIEAILANNANINIFSNQRTTLQAVLDAKEGFEQSNLDMFKFLLEHGANPLAQNGDGTTILDYIEARYQIDPTFIHYIALLKEGKYTIPAHYGAFRTGMKRKMSNFRMARLTGLRKKV